MPVAPPSAADPAAGDRFVASDLPTAPAVDEAAAIAQGAMRFAEDLRTRLWRDLFPVARRSLQGDHGARQGLERLAAGSDEFAAAARAIAAHHDDIAAIVAETTVDGFARRAAAFTHRLFVTVARMAMQGSAAHSAVRAAAGALADGPIALLEEVVAERFGSDQSPAARRLRHDILPAPATAMMLLREPGSPSDRMESFRTWAGPEFNAASRLLRDRAVMATLAAGVQGADAGMAIGIEIPETLQFAAGVDVGEVDLILGELATNAVKYRDQTRTPPRLFIGWDTTMGALVVEDNGTGIADIARIWEDGFREAERHPGVPGTGTGLWSLKQRIEALGWTIEVESQLGVGTRFIITPKAGDIIEGTHPSSGPSGSPAGGGGASGGADPDTGAPPSPVVVPPSAFTAGLPFNGLIVEPSGVATGDDQVPAADDADDAAVPGALILTGAQPDAITVFPVAVPPAVVLVQ